MSTDAAARHSEQLLFRRSAIDAAGHRLSGKVTLAMPPSTAATIAIAVAVLAALVGTTFVVEVPRRSRAVGVLMPAGGLTDIVATRPGQVDEVLVDTGEDVPGGRLLLTVASARNHGGDSAAMAMLRSLDDELQLTRSGFRRAQELASDRAVALQRELEAVARQLAIARQKQSALADELAAVEGRIDRLRRLESGGHIPRDVFEVEQVALNRLRVEHIDFERTVLDLSLRRSLLSGEQEALRKQHQVDAIAHEIAVARLEREIETVRRETSQRYTVSQQNVVAQVLVRPGDAVQAGQVMARLRRPDDRLQAWLYLPTASARIPEPGQEVQISLDAYPRQVYGTQSAVVAAVSDTALMPPEVRAPLLLGGPVFEIKAELNFTGKDAGIKQQLLSPGMSFYADVIEQRLTLYEWLKRSLAGRTADAIG